MDTYLSQSLTTLTRTSAALSSRLTSPVSAFSRCAAAAASAIQKNPTDDRAITNALAPLGAHMEDVEESSFSAGPGDLLEAHLPALAAAVKAFTCLTTAPPRGAVADARSMCARRLAPVRAKGPEHNAWADALDAVLRDMEQYCREALPGPLGSPGVAAAAAAAAAPPAAAAHTASVRHAPVRTRAPARERSADRPGVVRAASGGAGAGASGAGGAVATARGVASVGSGGGSGGSGGGGSGSGAAGGSAADRACVKAFDELLDGPAAQFADACAAVGREMLPVGNALVDAFRAERDYVAFAAVNKKPAEPDYSEVAKAMGRCAELAQDYPPRGPFAGHVQAIQESVSALGWVAVDSGATAFVGDQAGAGQMYVDRVKMAARRMDNQNDHREWAGALETLFKELKAYVKEHHTNTLQWNVPVTRSFSSNGGVGAVASRVSSLGLDDEGDAAGGADAVSAFNDIITGSLAEYVSAAGALGSDMKKQTSAFVDAWKEEAAFVAKASKMSKPAEPDFATVGGAMGKVVEVGQDYPPRGDFTNHITAVSESVAALGWIAVDSGATGFVGDQAGAGQMYVDRVKMAAKKTSDPTAHRAWAAALETLFKDLKAYVKEYHTNSFAWNSASMRKARSASRGRSVGGAVSSAGDEGVGGGADPVSAFKAILDGPLAKYVSAASALGADLKPQTDAFVAAWKAEEAFVAKAVSSKKPAEPDFSTVGGLMGRVSEIGQEYPPRGEFANHVTAVSESVAALGWIAVDSGATGFVGDQAGAGQMYVDRAKMAAKKTSDPSAHRAWAAALEDLFKELKAYVKEYHTNSLAWNSASMRRARSASRDTASVSGAGVGGGTGGTDPISAFRALIDGPLADYLSAAKALSGDLADQSSAFAEAWKAEEAFITKAIATPKPEEPDFSSVAGPMGAVGEIGQSYPPRGDFINHVTAVSESVAALGWIAVDSAATSFVGDQAGAGQMYIDRAKMAAKNTSNPSAHRAWAAALENLFKELKAYVKEYHTTSLRWNSATRGAGARAPVRRTSGVSSGGVGGSPVNCLGEFAALVSGPVKECVDSGRAIGGGLGVQCTGLLNAFKAEYEFLVKATNRPKPDADSFTDLIDPIGAAMGEVADAPNPTNDHLMTAMTEAIPALGWIAVDVGPSKFIAEYSDAGAFYISKALMAARSLSASEKSKVQDFSRKFKDVYTQLGVFVKAHHVTGLIWNNKVEPPAAVNF